MRIIKLLLDRRIVDNVFAVIKTVDTDSYRLFVAVILLDKSGKGLIGLLVCEHSLSVLSLCNVLVGNGSCSLCYRYNKSVTVILIILSKAVEGGGDHIVHNTLSFSYVIIFY